MPEGEFYFDEPYLKTKIKGNQTVAFERFLIFDYIERATNFKVATKSLLA